MDRELWESGALVKSALFLFDLFVVVCVRRGRLRQLVFVASVASDFACQPRLPTRRPHVGAQVLNKRSAMS